MPNKNLQLKQQIAVKDAVIKFQNFELSRTQQAYMTVRKENQVLKMKALKLEFTVYAVILVCLVILLMTFKHMFKVNIKTSRHLDLNLDRASYEEQESEEVKNNYKIESRFNK